MDFLLAQIYGLKGDTGREEQQLRQYLGYSHDPKYVAVAKQMLAKLEDGQRDVTENLKSQNSGDNPGQWEQRWEPAAIDEDVPPILDNPTCPLSQILHEVGQRAVELVENLQRFTATEQIEHTEFGKDGKPRGSNSELFDYVAEISPAPSKWHVRKAYQ